MSWDQFLKRTWEGIEYSGRESFAASPKTGYDKKKLLAIGKKISTLPADKKFIKKTFLILRRFYVVSPVITSH